MHPARLQDLLRLGPDERIVFMRDLPTPARLARQIASLANTHGGTIVVGVDAHNAVVGVRDPQAALSVAARAAQQLQPPLLIEPGIVAADNKTVLLIDVPQGSDPPYTTADGQIMVRRGRSVVAAGAEHAADLARRALRGAALVPLAPPDATRRTQPKSATATVDLDHILLKLERLIIANAELTRKLDDANSWRARITDQVIGAVIGLLVSVVVYWIGIN
jgi:hypothetical protein